MRWPYSRARIHEEPIRARTAGRSSLSTTIITIAGGIIIIIITATITTTIIIITATITIITTTTIIKTKRLRVRTRARRVRASVMLLSFCFRLRGAKKVAVCAVENSVGSR